MLNILRKGALDKGAGYVNGEVTEFVFDEPDDLVIEGVDQATQKIIRGVMVSFCNFVNQETSVLTVTKLLMQLLCHILIYLLLNHTFLLIDQLENSTGFCRFKIKYNDVDFRRRSRGTLGIHLDHFENHLFKLLLNHY